MNQSLHQSIRGALDRLQTVDIQISQLNLGWFGLEVAVLAPTDKSDHRQNYLIPIEYIGPETSITSKEAPTGQANSGSAYILDPDLNAVLYDPIRLRIVWRLNHTQTGKARPSTDILNVLPGTETYNRLNRAFQAYVDKLGFEEIDLTSGINTVDLPNPYQLIDGVWQPVGHPMTVLRSEVGTRYTDIHQLPEVIRQHFVGPFRPPETI